MSERKVLNKYYPPDFDPSKIPRMKLPKNRQYTVRLMAPFNMRCKTCGEYIYKGKKFNARKEDVEGEDYFGIRIYRFYIKCTRCLQEISFKTDPKNTDYEIEAGATRNFMALKLAEEQAQREEDERKEEEANNPMKLLENRTQQSKHELELLESLEDLKDLNRRQRSIDFDAMLSNYNTQEAREKILKMQEEEDEQFIKSVFGGNKRVIAEEIVEVTEGKPPAKKVALGKSTSNSVRNEGGAHPSDAQDDAIKRMSSLSNYNTLHHLFQEAKTNLAKLSSCQPGTHFELMRVAVSKWGNFQGCVNATKEIAAYEEFLYHLFYYGKFVESTTYDLLKNLYNCHKVSGIFNILNCTVVEIQSSGPQFDDIWNRAKDLIGEAKSDTDNLFYYVKECLGYTAIEFLLDAHEILKKNCYN